MVALLLIVLFLAVVAFVALWRYKLTPAYSPVECQAKSVHFQQLTDEGIVERLDLLECSNPNAYEIHVHGQPGVVASTANGSEVASFVLQPFTLPSFDDMDVVLHLATDPSEARARLHLELNITATASMDLASLDPELSDIVSELQSVHPFRTHTTTTPPQQLVMYCLLPISPGRAACTVTPLTDALVNMQLSGINAVSTTFSVLLDQAVVDSATKWLDIACGGIGGTAFLAALTLLLVVRRLCVDAYCAKPRKDKSSKLQGVVNAEYQCHMESIGQPEDQMFTDIVSSAQDPYPPPELSRSTSRGSHGSADSEALRMASKQLPSMDSLPETPPIFQDQISSASIDRLRDALLSNKDWFYERTMEEDFKCYDVSTTPWRACSAFPGTLVRVTSCMMWIPKEGELQIVQRIARVPDISKATFLFRVRDTTHRAGGGLDLASQNVTHDVPFGPRLRVQEIFSFRSAVGGGVHLRKWLQVVWVDPLPWALRIVERAVQKKTASFSREKGPPLVRKIADVAVASRHAGLAELSFEQAAPSADEVAVCSRICAQNCGESSQSAADEPRPDDVEAVQAAKVLPARPIDSRVGRVLDGLYRAASARSRSGSPEHHWRCRAPDDSPTTRCF